MNVRRMTMNTTTSEPKRWWFALPVPVALLAAFIIMLVRFEAHSPDHSVGDFLGCMLDIAVVGGITFPLGLFAPFVWNADLFQSYDDEMVIAGWILYAALTLAGCIRPRKVLLWTICTLLVLNIGGCHLPQINGAFRWSP